MTKTSLKVGMIVTYQNGHYRITAVRGEKVNLGAVWGKHIYYKGISADEVFEDEAAWYAAWQQTESYRCM